MNASNRAYRADIDGLRAVAVLSVVCCHAGLALPGGYVGVDVFFVISGYLITGILRREIEEGTFSFLNFWVRRIRRILPALVVVTAATLVAGWFLLIPRSYRDLGQSVIALALLSSNVLFWKETDYFAVAAEVKPLLHTWSLAVEEQFYLFVPLFLVLITRLRRPGRAALVIALIAAASLAWSVRGVADASTAAFYLLPSRAWELLAGALLAMRPPGSLVAAPRRRELASAAGLALILVPCVLYTEATPFPGLAAVPPVLGSALLILCGMTSQRHPTANRLLSWRPMVAVGRISYSLYLWHWPLIAFARELFPTPPSLALRLSQIAASLVLATLSWRFVETPFRTRRVLANRGRLLASAVGAVAVLLGTGLTIWRGRGFEDRLPPRARVYAATARNDARYERHLSARSVPDKLTRLGDPGAPPRLLVWGDSHAMAVLPAIDALGREAGIGARAATHAATAPVLGMFIRHPSGLNEDALPFSAAVVDYACRGDIRAVLLVARWEKYFADPRFSRHLLATVDRLVGEGITVYFMKDVPIYEFDVSTAIQYAFWWDRDRARLAMPVAAYEAQGRFLTPALPELEGRGVVVLEPFAVDRTQPGPPVLWPFDADGSFYRDNHHLSTHGALALKPVLGPVFRALGPETGLQATGAQQRDPDPAACRGTLPDRPADRQPRYPSPGV